MSGAATGLAALAPSPSPLHLTVAEKNRSQVELVQVMRGAPPHFRPEGIDNIFCLELSRAQFGVQDAIRWVRAAHNDAEVRSGRMKVPCIVVLGDARTLSAEELFRLSQELVPAGAYFARWPANCNSFEAAFTALRDDIARHYGPVDFSDAPQWGRGAVVPVG